MRRFLLFLMPLAIASCSQGPVTDIALNRTAVASSNYDFYLNVPGEAQVRCHTNLSLD